MKCEAEGIILVELPVKRGTTANGNDWESREYVMETSERYHSKMKFGMISFDGPIENPPKQGDKVKIYFTVTAREHNGSWYNGVKAHRIERTQ